MGLELTLPYPPSTNTYWRHVGHKTLLSAKGRAYRENVSNILFCERVKPIKGRLHVRVRVFPPDKRRRDLDNVLKALLDALEHGGAYVDDSQIDRLEVERCEVEKGGAVNVRIWED